MNWKNNKIVPLIAFLLVIVIFFILSTFYFDVDKVVCNESSIKIGEGCCLDVNYNGICDVNETTTTSLQATITTLKATTTSSTITISTTTVNTTTIVLTTIAKSGIECYLNSDCGNNGTKIVNNRTCRGNNVIKQYIVYRCSKPGTVDSECIGRAKTEFIESCYGNKTCRNGECL